MLQCGNPINSSKKDDLPPVSKDTESVKKEEIIPSVIKNYLDNKLPNYKIPTLQGYINDWEEFVDDVTFPFICSSDFNGDEKADYALMLISEYGEHHLVAFNSSLEGYSHHLIRNYSKSEKIGVILFIEKKGNWELIDETIFIPNDAIGVILPEESLEYAYYWDGQKYEKVLAD